MEPAEQTQEAGIDTRELERRRRHVIADLRKALRQYRLVIIVGAGVTLGATTGPDGAPPRLTWAGLIKNGLDYLISDVYNGTQDDRIRRAYSALESGNAEELSDAAMVMKAKLEQCKRYPTWLTSVFRDVFDEIQDTRVLEALKLLHRMGALLLTTNYDDILEKYCGLQRIRQSDLDDVLKFKSGDKDGVFHLHGSYEDPSEVVLDVADYSRITHADEVQNILQTCMETKTVLFVGCGSGLEDPNFGPLLKWFQERHRNIPNRHCILLRDDDPLDVSPLTRIRVGPAYENVDSFLLGVVDPPLQVAAPGTGNMNSRDLSLTGTSIDKTTLLSEGNTNNEAAKAREFFKLEAEQWEERRNIQARQLQECLESLSFPEMTHRRKSANRAFPGTCSWIQSHTLFQRWLEQQCGLLWINGNPGSGKSTIMAFLFEEMVRASTEREQTVEPSPPVDDRSILVLSFFFHGRGSPLEKTQTGMFRSLLHQILTPLAVGDLSEPICSKILKAFLENSAGGHGWEWQLEELRTLFTNSCMAMASRRRIRIIVDALDEAGVEAAVELLTYFHVLIQDLKKLEVDIRICIACRHYPVLKIDTPRYTIAVDTQNRGDIKTYVEHKIHSSIPATNDHDETARENITRIISYKAGFSFQWACLITPMVIRYYHDGESLDGIQKRLANVPPGLSEVYRHIFSVVIGAENMTPKRSLLLMQWICLAQRRLSLLELQFAMSSENQADQLPLPCNEGALTADYSLTKERVRSWSGGLAEVVYTYDHNNLDLDRYYRRSRIGKLRYEVLENKFGFKSGTLEKEFIRQTGNLRNRSRRFGHVQFIHQSVNDFLLSEGFSLLSHISKICPAPNPGLLPTSAATIIQQHHERLVAICLNYLQRIELQGDRVQELCAREYKRIHTEMMTNTYIRRFPNRLGGLKSFPSFEDWPVYTDVPKLVIDCLFPFLSYIIDFWYVHVGKMEHVASQNIRDLVKRLSSGIFDNLLAIRAFQRKETFNGQKLIHFVSSRSDMEMIVQLLIDDGQARVKDAMGREALHYAIKYGQKVVVAMLLKGGSDVEARTEPLPALAWSGMEVNMAPLSASAPSATTPLQLAALHGHEGIMRLLLNHGVSRDSLSLKLARLRMDYDMVTLLLKHQWEVTNEYLYDALVSSSFEIFELFFSIRKGNLDIDFRNTEEPDSTMLHYAVRSGKTRAVKLLLDNGAKVLTPYVSGETMLKYAEFRCQYFQHKDLEDFMEIKRLFLQHRDDLRTAAEEIVSWCSWKKENVLRFLHTKGHAPTPLDLFRSRTPLHWASERIFAWAFKIEIEEFLQVLNACERDMHVQDRDGMTPLHIAASNGHLDIAEELVKRGSNLNAKMPDGCTPLCCARKYSRTNIVAYLESVALE